MIPGITLDGKISVLTGRAALPRCEFESHPWSSLIVGDEGCIGQSCKLLCFKQTEKNCVPHVWPPSPNSFPHHFVARVEHPFHSVTTSVTRWLDNGFNIWPFRTIKICPNSIRMAKISLNFLPNTKYTLKKRSRTVNFGQFFAESVHTSRRPFHFISERNRSWRLFFSISIAFKKIWTLN